LNNLTATLSDKVTEGLKYDKPYHTQPYSTYSIVEYGLITLEMIRARLRYSARTEKMNVYFFLGGGVASISIKILIIHLENIPFTVRNR
jgi:hypothetical protein